MYLNLKYSIAPYSAQPCLPFLAVQLLPIQYHLFCGGEKSAYYLIPLMWKQPPALVSPGLCSSLPPPPPHTTSTKISSPPPSLSPRLKNYSNWTLPVGTKCAVQYFFWHRMLIASEKFKTSNGAFKLLVLKFHNFVDLPCLAFKSGHFLPRILFPRGFLCKSRLQWLNQVFFVLGGLLH